MKNKLILGTVQFGMDYGINNNSGKPPRQEVFNILKLASESSITTLDTADHYGNASALIGEFHKTFPSKFLINTKFKVGQDADIRSQLTHSINEVNTKGINVYFYHSFQDLIQYPKIKYELTKLKEASIINQIGVSIYSNQELETASEMPEIDVIQIPFNLLDNISQRGKSIKKAKDNGKLIQARSLFLQGLFFKPPADFPNRLSALSKYVIKLTSITEESGLTMENICLAYALSQSDIDQVIIGVDNVDQLRKNIKYSNTFLDNGIKQEIDAIKVVETELLYPTNWK